MKKRPLQLTLLLGILAFSLRVSAENNVYKWTVNGSETLITAGIKYLTLGDIVWGVDWQSFVATNQGHREDKDCLVFGSYTAPLRNLTFSSKAFAGKTIVSISICANRPQNATTTFVAKINGEPVGYAQELASGTITEGFTDYTFDNINIAVPSKGKVELAFANTNEKTGIYSGNGGFNIKSITIEYIGSKIAPQPIPKKPVLKFAADSHSIEVGETSESLELTKETDGDITYTSSNPDVATVDTKSGEVTGVGAGTAIITATSEETVAYQEGSASYSLVVTEPNPEPIDPSGTPAIFNFAEPSSLHHTSPLGESGMSGVDPFIHVNDVPFVEGPVTIVGTSLNNGLNRLYCDISDSHPEGTWSYRMSINTVLTIMCLDNHHLVSVVFEPEERFAKILTDSDLVKNMFSSGEYDAKTMTLNIGQNETKITITPPKALGFNKITVYYTSSSTGISDIVTDNDNSPMEYYNLQGVRVTSPTPGLYIRVQGKQTTKVYLK